jgi:hypothetical protein
MIKVENLVMIIYCLSKIVLSFIGHDLDNFQIKICLNPFSSKEAWKGVFSNLCPFYLKIPMSCSQADFQ